MTKFFNADPMGFYDSEINMQIPDTAVQITDEKHIELLNQQAKGKLISADKDGNPIAIDPPIPDPQIEINAKSRKYLSDTDWYVIRFSETGQAIPQEILDARAAARIAIVE